MNIDYNIIAGFTVLSVCVVSYASLCIVTQICNTAIRVASIIFREDPEDFA